jgi:hypothetical protein
MQTEIPQKYRILYQKAISGQSKTAAIQVHCLECCGWQKEEVRECTDINCALFAYRPYTREDKATADFAPRVKNRDVAFQEGENSEQPVLFVG